MSSPCHANTNTITKAKTRTKTHTLSLSGKPDGACEKNKQKDQVSTQQSLASPDAEDSGDDANTTPSPPTATSESPALNFTPPPDVATPCTSPSWQEQAHSVLDFLNDKTGRVYRPVDTNLKLITARLKSGATVLQCRQVIARKARQWKGRPEMAPYLRPATLFNATKFEQYLGELVPAPDDPAKLPSHSPPKCNESNATQGMNEDVSSNE